MTKIKSLATGIGSLPYETPEEALRVIFAYLPAIPFWPQLPRKDALEGMVAQFSRNLPCLKVAAGSVVFDPSRKESEFETFYEHLIAEDTEYFELGKEYACGFYAFIERLKTADLSKVEFLKCHVTGPFTFAASLKDETGAALLHDPVYMQIVTRGLGMKARWQIRQLEQFGKKIIIFMDEPYLGCFGSAYTPLTREQALTGLVEFTDQFASGNVLIGVHCCGNTDWSLFTDTPSLSIINFDAFSYMDKVILYADSLKKFLNRDGYLCWGVVPTHEFSGRETKESLSGIVNKGIDVLVKKGISRQLLQERLLLTPSCGLGTIDEAKAALILKLLADTAAYMRQA
jgi:methionine synthase II (cobalamin-independent)